MGVEKIEGGLLGHGDAADVVEGEIEKEEKFPGHYQGFDLNGFRFSGLLGGKNMPLEGDDPLRPAVRDHFEFRGIEIPDGPAVFIRDVNLDKLHGNGDVMLQRGLFDLGRPHGDEPEKADQESKMKRE
jgi:hypothetical protein